jgi:predicted PurR-regulated permease PerM
MEDQEFFEEENLKLGFKKIGELFSGEIKLLRTILISCLTVIIICILLYFNYILIGQFFTTIFLAFIASLALKPTKERVISKLNKYFIKKKYYIKKSLLFSIVNYVIKLAQYISYLISKLFNLVKDNKANKNSENTKERNSLKLSNNSYSNKSNNNSQQNSSSLQRQGSFTSEAVQESSYISIFNDRNYLFSLCIFYVMIFKLEFHLSLTLFIIYIIIDLFLRLFLDIIVFFFKIAKKSKLLNPLIFDDKNSLTFSENMHYIVSLLIIFFLTLILLCIFLCIIWLLYIDMNSIISYLKQNNDYMNYLKNMVPENFKEYYDMDNFYNNHIFINLKSFESYINKTIVENFEGSEYLQGNHTLYDISNNIYSFIKDPSLIIKAASEVNPISSFNKSNYPLIYMIENNCKKFEEEVIYRVISYSGIEYIKRFYCGMRIIIDRFNLNLSISYFSKYINKGYIFMLNTFKLIIGSIFINFLSFSLEIINYLMLFFLFISCLYNFLKTKEDFIKDMLKFLPLKENKIEEIHKSFHNSIQGVFISTLDIFIFHSLLTWLIFDFCNIRFVFILSISSGIISLVPIINPCLILIPGNFLNFIDNEFSLIKIIMLNLSYYILINFSVSDIYKKNVKKSDPYITGLSFVMGMYTFGFKGLIYGPVLLCVSITVIDLIKILIKIK